jgi:hypothetical protein
MTSKPLRFLPWSGTNQTSASAPTSKPSTKTRAFIAPEPIQRARVGFGIDLLGLGSDPPAEGATAGYGCYAPARWAC